MQITTLIRFLMGSRQAIIDVANSCGSLLLGALFVLSAGFAREYDGKDLLHEPWHLLVPLLASLATSFVLYCLLFVGERIRGTGDSDFVLNYRRFLSLYWMTAPLAWLYAIPVEEWMSPGAATRANLSLLGIVSVWRVLLITRCASVLFGASFIAAFFLVMLFADSLALVILALTPLPIFNIMGGISLTESESVIRGVACNVQFLGGISWLVWFIGTLIVFGWKNHGWTPLGITAEPSMRITKPLWSVAVLSLVVWVFVLPTTQPSQRLRREVESDLLGGQIERAIQEMSAHDRQSFPPSWDPPPWPGYGQDSPSLLKVLQEINNDSVAEWVQGIYFDKLALQFERYESAFSFWNSLDDEEFAEYMIFFRSNSKTQELIRRHSVTLRRYFEYSTQQENGRAKSFRLLLKDLAIEIPEVEEPIHEPSPDEVDQAAESVDKVSNENQ